MEKTTEKNRKVTTIEISIETYEKLHSLKLKIEKVVGKPISFDKLCQIIFSVKDFNEMLSELMTE
jgi:hypothetical protein